MPNKSAIVIFIFVEEHQNINALQKKNGNSADAILQTNERGKGAGGIKIKVFGRAKSGGYRRASRAWGRWGVAGCGVG